MCILGVGNNSPCLGHILREMQYNRSMECNITENGLYLEIENHPSRNPGLNYLRPEDGLFFRMIILEKFIIFRGSPGP